MTARRMKSLFLTVFAGLSLLIPVCVLGDSTPIAWGTQANHLKLGPGKSMLVTCPAKGQIVPRLWGTDIYTDDSSICTAAVHAGLINTASGGTVLVEGLGGQPSYSGSQRNGLNSGNYGGWGGSFTVAKAPGGTGIVPPPPPPPSGQVSLSVSPVQVAPGGKVTVQWSAPGRTGQTNWVGLYRAGTPADSPNLNRPIWTYVRQESGSHEFQLPIQAQPGQYVFRLFYGDGYDLRATSNTFNVGSGTPPPPPNENQSTNCEPSGSGADRGVRWLWYSLISTSKGVQECHMGHHTFCAMASSQQGTARSLCFVGQNLGDWILKAVVESDPNGTHQCSAVCMDIRGFGIE